MGMMCMRETRVGLVYNVGECVVRWIERGV